MPEQLNLMDAGQVIPTSLHSEMQQSYLEYAMSTIVGRALPDVRDGLKPVHRRILYAMHELGLTPDRPYRKCARVVGDVLGKYHPHGDKAVYDALVRMVQDFASRYPLLQGHGNFGSIDNDPAAAMRYTETRLAPIAHEAVLEQIGEATVDFVDNFDSSQQEPSVLPSQLPFLLLNGCSGIAVGMATNIPPHNLEEIVDGLIAMIDRPNLTDEALMKLVPGPDFPTGAHIIGNQGIEDAYRKGRGSVIMRGVSHVEEIPGSRGRRKRQAIIITELPYQVNKAGWLEKVATRVNHGKIDGISDLRDESDRDGVRVVIELKRETDPNEVLAKLYKQTELQSTFGTILLALVNGQPRQLSLREALQEFLTFREETLQRQYRYERDRVSDRLEILDGLLIALDNLDETIEILRNSPDGGSAEAQLIEILELSQRQARDVLGMPLRRLTGMEKQKLQTEQQELRDRAATLDSLLGNRHELLKSMKKELRALKRRFKSPRRTQIISEAEATTQAEVAVVQAETPETGPTAIQLTERGFARRLTVKAYQRQQQEITGAAAGKPAWDEHDDLPILQGETEGDRKLLAITRLGKAYNLGVDELPKVTRQTPKGTPLITLLPPAVRANALDRGDGDVVEQLNREIIQTFLLEQDWLETPECSLVLLTQQGRIKRLPLEDFTELTNRGLTALKLKAKDEVMAATLAKPGDRIIIATSSGRIIPLALNDTSFPFANRNSQGLVGVKLGRQEQLVGCIGIAPPQELLLVSARGYGKRLPVQHLRFVVPGRLGSVGITFATKGDSLATLAAVTGDSVVTLGSEQSRSLRIMGSEIPLQRPDNPGNRLGRLPAGDQVVRVSVTPSFVGS
ncbi:MAG: DNA topoisomerase (ATP-hydrolyzing) subunit A [Cyanophyceae cyanobacterium]